LEWNRQKPSRVCRFRFRERKNFQPISETSTEGRDRKIPPFFGFVSGVEIVFFWRILEPIMMIKSLFAFSAILATSAFAEDTEWRPLFDETLSQWEVFIGVPHKTVEIPGMPCW
jgi:hypothetical protein